MPMDPLGPGYALSLILDKLVTPLVVGVVLILVAKYWFGYLAAKKTLPAAPVDPELRARLERMEQAIESIAVETERLSEGQRFTTRLLTEQSDRERKALPRG